MDPSRLPDNPEGNLFRPSPGDPGVDGPFTDRVKPARQEFLTSRARDVLTLGVAAVGLVGLAATAALATLPRPRRR